MTRRLIGFGSIVLFLCAFTLPQQPSVAAQSSRAVLVVVSAGLGGSDIPLRTLRHAFEAYPTEFNGTRLVPFNLGVGTPARAQVDKVLFGLSPDKVPLFWIDRKIRQSADPPRSLASPELVLRVVASLKGGIGYLETAPSAIPSALRVLSIDGKHPSEPDYPLLVQ